MEQKSSKWLTKRMFFSVAGLATATTMLALGKMNGGDWCLALAICIAGHHAEDIIKAYKGT